MLQKVLCCIVLNINQLIVTILHMYSVCDLFLAICTILHSFLILFLIFVVLQIQCVIYFILLHMFTFCIAHHCTSLYTDGLLHAQVSFLHGLRKHSLGIAYGVPCLHPVPC